MSSFFRPFCKGLRNPAIYYTKAQKSAISLISPMQYLEVDHNFMGRTHWAKPNLYPKLWCLSDAICTVSALRSQGPLRIIISFGCLAEEKTMASSCATSTFTPLLNKLSSRNSMAMVGLLSYAPKSLTPISLTRSFSFISLSTPRKPLKKSFQGDFFTTQFFWIIISYMGLFSFLIKNLLLCLFLSY